MTQAIPRKDTPDQSPRGLCGIDDLEDSQISALLDRAGFFLSEKNPRPVLEGRIILNAFLENSTRTRVSFEIAALRLGAQIVNITADHASIKKGETLEDTLATLAAMEPDALVLRSGQNGASRMARDVFSCPVINGGDGTNEHPTQGLLDALTLRRHFGRIKGLNIVICGDILHSRVARSNFLLLTRLGAHVRLAGPDALLPRNLPATPDFTQALEGADAVMMLRLQKERMEKTLSMEPAEYFSAYGLDRKKLARAKPHAVVLHPGPLNRGLEIAPEVADDPVRSLILEQVKNGVALRMACLEHYLKP